MKPTRLLVVDDDDSIREVFQRQLGKSGFDVSVASSAEEAMRMIGRVQPAVVITDVRMAGASGLELLGWLRESVPESDVLVMTAHEDMQMALTAMQGGAYDFLAKPIDLDEIERVIDRCLRDRAMRVHAQPVTGAAAPLPDQLIGRDPAMIEISKLIAAVAPTRMPVLIRGETGTGKEVIARAIHANSLGAAQPFIAVNCTAIPETLLESELFGHTRGSFSGATSDRKGRFEVAGSGTIFLDEIGDVTPAFQAKVLRILQSGEYFPVGAEQPRRTTARVLAATHRPLERMLRDGTFREDLYFRLRVVEIQLPPLRERRVDIRMIAERLVDRLAREMGRPAAFIPDEVMRVLEQYDWPGNVRELENALARALVLTRTPALSLEHFELKAPRDVQRTVRDARQSGDLALSASERDHVLRVLAAADGKKSKAAKLLRISRQRLDRILDRHGLARGSDSADEAAIE